PARPSVLAPLLSPGLMERLLATAMARGGEFAEVYVERAVSTAVSLDERKIKSAQTGLIQGVGVRGISNGRVGYAYSDDLEEKALIHAAGTAALIAQGPGADSAFKVSREPAPSFYRVPSALAEIDVRLKTDLVRRADKAAHAFDPRIKQVIVTYA